MLNELRDKNIHIVGISGTEGSSLALFLIAQKFKKITGHDFSNRKDFKKNYDYYHQELNKKKVEEQFKKISKLKINFKNNYLKNIEKADIILVPSSWFRYQVNNKLKKYSKDKHFWNWYNLLLYYFKGTLIGVTGTAGKGTTTNLIYNILKQAKKNVFLVGNSWQLIDFNKIFSSSNVYIVAEISNRTLTFASKVKKSPDISVITNITKNHLDDHQGSFKKYFKTKLNITKYQGNKDLLLLNNDLRNIKTKAKKQYFSFKNIKVNNNNLIGEHLLSDVAAAIKVAQVLKISQVNINNGLNSFTSRPGRLQYLGDKKGIHFINDAASTRSEATIYAIQALPKNKVNLILEGSRYKLDNKQYIRLIRVIKKYKVKNILISGQICNKLFPLLMKYRVNVIKTNNLLNSIKQAYKLSVKDDYILLSPSAESLGAFRDYRERIKLFNDYFKQ